MDNSSFIHGHYNGEIFVADEPVPFPVNQPVLIQPDYQTHSTNSDKKPESSEMNVDAENQHKLAADLTKEERLAALEELVKMSANDPLIPLEALTRENMYGDYGR